MSHTYDICASRNIRQFFVSIRMAAQGEKVLYTFIVKFNVQSDVIIVIPHSLFFILYRALSILKAEIEKHVTATKGSL